MFTVRQNLNTQFNIGSGISIKITNSICMRMYEAYNLPYQRNWSILPVFSGHLVAHLFYSFCVNYLRRILTHQGHLLHPPSVQWSQVANLFFRFCVHSLDLCSIMCFPWFLSSLCPQIMNIISLILIRGQASFHKES